MRRGNLSQISVILIIIAGFFTLVSFALDQMVVQTEDKFRKKELEYKQTLFYFHTHESNNDNIQYIAQIITSKFLSLHFQNETNKEILGYLVEDKYADKFYQGLEGVTSDQLKKFTKDMKRMHKRNYFHLYSDYILAIKAMQENLKYISFFEADLQKKYKKIIEIVDIDFEDHFKNFKLENYSEDDLNSYKKINKVYFNLLSFNDVFISVGNLLDDLKTETAQRWKKSGEKIELIQEELELQKIIPILLQTLFYTLRETRFIYLQKFKM